MHLARNELRLGIAMAAARFPSLRVQDGVDLDAIPFGATLRGPDSLPVTLR